MPLIETTGIFIGTTIAGWIIKKLCDGALRQIKGLHFGTKEKRALETAVSISLEKVKNQNPVIYEKLFKEKSPVCQASTEEEVESWLTKLYIERHLVKEIGIASRNYVLKHYSIEATVAYYIKNLKLQ